MMRSVLLSMILTGFAVAQGNSAPGAAPAASDEIKPGNTAMAQANPAPTAPVITIAGVCSTPAPSLKTRSAATPIHKTAAGECKTVVTRKEFEELADALPVPPAARKQFATWYATALIMSSEAHKRGLDRGQRYEELLRVTRLQVLAQQLARDLQEEAAKVPDQEIENYYHNNAAAYQEATLDRLYVPRTQQQDPPKDSKETDADSKKRQTDSEAAMKKEADDLRARAAAGEDFAKLQTEGYKFANFKAAPPEVKMEKTRRTTLPPAQAAVFDLDPGAVSQVFTDPGGYFVYKLEQKDTIPLDDKLREEIRASLQKQRMQDATQTMQQSAKPAFDEAYFAAISPAPPAQKPRGDAPVPMRMPAPRAPNAPSAEPK